MVYCGLCTRCADTERQSSRGTGARAGRKEAGLQSTCRAGSETTPPRLVARTPCSMLACCSQGTFLSCWHTRRYEILQAEHGQGIPLGGRLAHAARAMWLQRRPLCITYQLARAPTISPAPAPSAVPRARIASHQVIALAFPFTCKPTGSSSGPNFDWCRSCSPRPKGDGDFPAYCGPIEQVSCCVAEAVVAVDPEMALPMKQWQRPMYFVLPVNMAA